MVEFFVLEGWRVGVDFAAEFFATEERFVDAAGGGAGEVFPDHRSFAELSEALEGQKNLHARPIHHRTEDLQVVLEQAAVQDVAGAGDLGQVNFLKSVSESVGHVFKLEVGTRGANEKPAVGRALSAGRLGDGQFLDVPGKAALVELVHERIRIALFHVPDAWLEPFAGRQHGASDGRRNAGRVADGLGFDLGEALLVVADVVDENLTRFTVFDAGNFAANAGLTFGAGAEGGWIGEEGLEELDGHNLMALEFNRVDAGHADVFQDAQVGQVVFREGHEEADALQAFDVNG